MKIENYLISQLKNISYIILYTTYISSIFPYYCHIGFILINLSEIGINLNFYLNKYNFMQTIFLKMLKL